MSIKATSLKAMVLLAAAMLSMPCVAAVLPNVGPSLPMPDSVTAVAPAPGRYARETLDNRLWKRPGLSVRDRSIVTVAALIARGQTTDLPFYIRLALDSGVKPSELSGIITHLAFYAGWENAMAAAAAAQPVFAERGIGPDQLAAADLQPLALDSRAEAERAASVDKALGDAAPALVQDTTDVLFRDLWLRPDLTPRDRSLVTVSALVATGQLGQLAGHLTRALGNGLTPAEASEAISHLAYYGGWPNAFSAAAIARTVFEQRRAQQQKQ